MKDEIKKDAGGCNRQASRAENCPENKTNTKESLNMSRSKFNTVELKKAAVGHWEEIITEICGIPQKVLDGCGHPCPKEGCRGDDRFTAFKDFDETGGVMCRHCFAKGIEDSPTPGDGIATIMWFTGCSFPNACRQIAKHLGKDFGDVVPEDEVPNDIIEDLCLVKSMPQESAIKYGAKVEMRGEEKVVRFPLYGGDGGVIGTFDLSPYPEKQKKLSKGMMTPDSKGGIHLPGVIPKAGETWLLCEGVKDPAALHYLGFENTAGMVGCYLNEACVPLFEGCTVILVPDLDNPAMRSSVTNANRLRKHGLDGEGNSTEKSIKVQMARLPGKIKDKGGEDVRDIWARDGDQVIFDAIERAADFNETLIIEGKRQISVDLADNDEQQVVDQVIQALGEQGFSYGPESNRIYQRAGKIVRIAENETGSFVSDVPKGTLRELISAAVDLLSVRGSETILNRPSDWLCTAIEQRTSYKEVRILRGIIKSPTLREDGTILQKPGYDVESKLYYFPDGKFEKIPMRPSDAQVKEAKDLLLDIISDFPFKSDVDKAVWFSLLFSLIARHGIDGNVPLTAITANCPGSGKSKLCDIAGLIAFGRPMPRQILSTDDAETSKLITTIARQGKSSVLFDNVDAPIGNSTLDAVLTGTTWEGRILGKSETTGEMPWFTVLVATGNNLQFKADMVRRVALCTLQTLEENPEDRQDFKHENLEKFVLENRKPLVIAALTILRGWILSNKAYSGKRLGSFEGWSELICGAIVNTGLPSPLESVSEVRRQDKTGDECRALIDALEAVCEKEGVTAQTISRSIDGASVAEQWTLMRDALTGTMDKVTSRKIGALLKKYKDRVCDGRRITGQVGSANRTYWKVEKVTGVMK